LGCQLSECRVDEQLEALETGLIVGFLFLELGSIGLVLLDALVAGLELVQEALGEGRLELVVAAPE